MMSAANSGRPQCCGNTASRFWRWPQQLTTRAISRVFGSIARGEDTS